MVEVYCTFDECLFYKPHDEDYGICTKDHITLDETVSERTCGCPDAEWEWDKPYLYRDIDGYLDEVAEPQTDCAWAAPDAPRTVPLYPMKEGEE